MVVSAKQTDLVRNGFMHETIERLRVGAFDDAGNNISFTPNGTDDDGLARPMPPVPPPPRLSLLYHLPPT